jgi:hypothetical protein
MKKLLFALTTALGLAYAKLVGGPMDGSEWDVKIKPDALFSFSHSDRLVFTHGRLAVLGDLPTDFPPATYSAESLDSETADTVWHAALAEPERGVVTWHGLVRGDMIEGVAVWWTREGKAKRFTFRGTRRA